MQRIWYGQLIRQFPPQGNLDGYSCQLNTVQIKNSAFPYFWWGISATHLPHRHTYPPPKKKPTKINLNQLRIPCEEFQYLAAKFIAPGVMKFCHSVCVCVWWLCAITGSCPSESFYISPELPGRVLMSPTGWYCPVSSLQSCPIPPPQVVLFPYLVT